MKTVVHCRFSSPISALGLRLVAAALSHAKSVAGGLSLMTVLQ
jgi:hypothetical protein